MNGYLIFILALLIFNWLLSLIVETLNVRNVSTEIPEEFQGIYDEEKYAKSQHYLKDNTRFGQIQAGIMLPLTIAFILFGGFRWVSDLAQSISGHMILQGLVFGGILMLIGQIAGLPFSIYSTFVIEEKYGFNKTTAKTFVMDLFKGLLLAVLIGTPIFALVLWIFDTVPMAWLWAWAALSIIQLFILFIAPVMILPLFNKFTPLEDGELRARIEEFADAQKYKLSGIFKIDGSKRSTKSNAYFTGFGKTKRIALFDTLIENHSVGELVGVLAHEIGHCKRGHIKKSILISLISSLLMFFILSLFISKQGLYSAFGLENTPLYAGLIFFGFLYAPISMILSLLGNILSRKHEFEADAFAAETTKKPGDLIAALKKLSVDNLSNLTPHPLKVFLEYSHPPVLERIKALKTFES
ncbi:M48 family metallopeptidase [Tichowtungia aerotolerans]|uniref:M48 family metalloprotease n=1 Tax=Tichowtungia aerotolerans TaxID=2697043 RepID=A0A6P1M760_9BACT|nr:M48 family metallopeptidase [Tichowtungia aerotolerans]QHI70420.1 M48 family metalloprotease [Tichowtungia aerotolerans]